jgi:hypothetical protein
MAKSSDLLKGDFGYVAYFVGFIVVPIGFAIGGGRIGYELLGQPVLGWVIGALGFVIGLAIGKYSAFGALYALFLGMMGGLAGLAVDWLVGWKDQCVVWGMVVGAGGGFLLGVVGTIVADVNAARPNAPDPLLTGGIQPQEPGEAQAAQCAPAPAGKKLVKRANVPLVVLGGLVLLAAPVPYFWLLVKASETGYSITVGVPVLLLGIVAAFVCFGFGSARFQCPVCVKNAMRWYEDKCSECGAKSL